MHPRLASVPAESVRQALPNMSFLSPIFVRHGRLTDVSNAFAGRRRGVRSWLSLVLLGAATFLSAAAAYARGPEPAQRIPLDPLGFQAISSRYLLEGATMLTVDFVDSRHLLVTFGIPKLMVRLADCPEDDEDRTVKAVLLELPTGRELAHAEWRFHDLGQYLWNLGDGHFLLRQRDELTTFSPLENLASGDPFAQDPFLHFDRRIEAILVTASHDLLSIETVKRKSPKILADPASHMAGANPSVAMPAARKTGLLRRDPNEPQPDSAPIEINFIRLIHLHGGAASPDSYAVGDAGANPRQPSRILASFDGRVRSEKIVNIPLTSQGFLETKNETRDGVLFDFVTFNGKVIELGDFATSCLPRPTFVSSSEFVTYGCRGSDDSLDLAGFNLHGDLIWQINFTDQQAYPSIVSAVSAGRFAFSRTITNSNVFGSETPSMSQLTAQEVRVIQTYNGKQLLRVTTSPIQRAGQNYALSPDGLNLAVVHDNVTPHGEGAEHNTAVEIYTLPPLSAKDEAQVKAEAAMAPEPSDARMRFSIQEIKAALKAKPVPAPAEQDASEHPTTPADSRIVGDEVPRASSPATASPSISGTTSTAGVLPASDPAPSCDPATDAKPATEACPVKPQAKSSDETAGDSEATSEHRRKPPTLYEPAPANSPDSPPQ